MRKITSEAIAAFNEARPYKKGNTKVEISRGNFLVGLYVHNNLIATKSSAGLEITNAGWATPTTTKERLNALDGVSIQQKKGKWYLNGVEWSGEWVKVSQ